MDRQKKYLFVLPNDTLGGAEQVLKMIAEHWIGAHVDVFFFSKKKSGGWDELKDTINLHYGSFASEHLGAFQFLLNSLVRRRNIFYDYVFTSHVYVTGIVGVLIQVGVIRKRYFVGRESTLIFRRFTGLKLQVYKGMYYCGYNSLDLLICQTQQMQQELLLALPQLEKKIRITVIPNPVDVNKAEQLSTNDFEENVAFQNFIVAAGRLIPEKGFDVLIRAFYRLRKLYPNLGLVILGEGPLRADLSNLIDRLDLRKVVILKGFVNNVFPYFAQAKVCVVSSRVEGFPNVLLQMMSQNERVVSTLCAGGINEIKGIFHAFPDNEDSLLEAMTSAIEEPIDGKRNCFDQFLNGRSVRSFLNQVNTRLSN